ncbi:hypothetical protein BJ122_11418 [Rhodopseudomonas faecalis]|uniref:Transmembrane protein n=1 Tax=Rhodopseudomonas faecalis TaxID=99655 RepID=A0A318TC37_9BRAD|nr:hypothetical protein [Rhodopseudomonas faecalis]PYF02103.1 hypothetical protein BJ122_11418 [Rhodopseudomonas faecalis]
MKRRLLQPLWVLLAIIFLIEAWFWDHLAPVVARLVAVIPLRELKAWLAGWVERLSPSAALLVFLVPVAPLYPLKFLALALMAGGHWSSGLAIFAFAHLIGLGVAAFIFDVTKPKLLQLNWFAAVYRFVIDLRAKAHAIVAPIMAQIRAKMAELLNSSGDGWAQRTLRRIGELRRRVRASRKAAR